MQSCLPQSYHNLYRDYSPTTGRYIQADPIEMAGDANPYLYTIGNSLRYTDPTGEFVPLTILAGIAIGVGSDLAFQATMNGLLGRPIFDLNCYDWGSVAISGGFGAIGAGPGVLAAKLAGSARGLGANPFIGKSPSGIGRMLEQKGFIPRGPDPVAGRGNFVNPRTGRGFHIDGSHPPPKGPHVGAHRPRGARGNLSPRDYPM
jgi:hypothetical protein